MAIDIVPARDERCDVCAGNEDRPRPKPGQRHSEREPVETMCAACYEDFIQDLMLRKKVERVEVPDDPSQN